MVSIPDTIEIGSRIILCGEGFPVQCKVLNSIPDLYLLHLTTIPCSQVGWPQMSLEIVRYPEEARLFPIESHCCAGKPTPQMLFCLPVSTLFKVMSCLENICSDPRIPSVLFLFFSKPKGGGQEMTTDTRPVNSFIFFCLPLIGMCIHEPWYKWNSILIKNEKRELAWPRAISCLTTLCPILY